MYIGQTNSTNDLIRTLSVEEVWTTYQTAGRGQQGNSWEAERGKNILMSYRLEGPIAAEKAFDITMGSSIAIAECLEHYLQGVAIKWPNDIYVGDKKICGILIESSLRGHSIGQAIVGIGLNVNQVQFISDAPNPTSIALETGHEVPLEPLYDQLVLQLRKWLHADASLVQEAYRARLYRREGYYRYRELATGKVFEAAIADIGAQGELFLKDKEGTVRPYLLKQIQFII